MKIAFFDAQKYDSDSFEKANKKFNFEILYLKDSLKKETTSFTNGCYAVCVFVHDTLSEEVLKLLKTFGVKVVLLRCAGFNNIDLAAAKNLGIKVFNVPSYSPYSIAEHTLTLILALNRKIHHAYNRVRNGDFSLNGLLGFELHRKTVGIIGTGKIGSVMAKIVKSIGCRTLAFDPTPNETCKSFGVEYGDLDFVFGNSDILTLHCNLKKENLHLINEKSIKKLKKGVMLINTSRGGLIDTNAIIEALKSGQIGSLGLDVYEEEESLFFKDLSEEIIQDDTFARLLTFPNVIITSHQAFFTSDALKAIADSTLQNLDDAIKNKTSPNELTVKP